MATATRQTKGGNVIKVEIVRDVVDKMWEGMVTGREMVERTTIVIKKADKVIAQGRELGNLYPQINKQDAEMAQKGAVARLGNAYLPAEVVALIKEAIAEADAAETGSEEFRALKQAAAEAKARAERRRQIEEPMIQQMEEFERRMNDPHSDL